MTYLEFEDLIYKMDLDLKYDRESVDPQIEVVRMGKVLATLPLDRPYALRFFKGRMKDLSEELIDDLFEVVKELSATPLEER